MTRLQFDSTPSKRFVKLVVLMALIGIAVFGIWMLRRPSESTPPAQASAPASLDGPKYTGAGSCASSNCHGGVVPLSDKRIQQNEYSTWMVKDKHAKAYDVLLNEQSKRIARHLNLDKPEASNTCLDCHATNVATSRRSRSFDLSDGVSCESCHGPAEQWLGPHTRGADATHEQSLSVGMVDTKNVLKRAEVCLSCHLGTDQKWVDHEMIAAGHPDLIFELDTFSAVMPAHWQETPDKGPWFGPRAWAVGQAVALRDGMKRLARRVENAAWGGAWPEFSEFDCYACHHSLREPAWRQIRGYYNRPPGYPPFNDSRYRVFRHVVSHVSAESQLALDQKISQLQTLLNQAGQRRRDIASVATEVASMADQLARQLAGQNFDERLTRAVLRAVSSDEQIGSLSGIRSAEQAAMTIETLYATYAKNVHVPHHSDVKAAISRLFDDLQDPARFDPARFAAHLQAVNRFFQ